MSCSESVTKVVEKYVESMKESSADKVREAFHPNAKVVGHLHGDFLEMSTEDFAGFVAAQEPAEVEYEILSTDVQGTTAAVKKSICLFFNFYHYMNNHLYFTILGIWI